MAWTSPRTWVSGETVTASNMNTHVRDNLKAIGDAWTSFTPTLSNFTLGNGTLTGAKIEAGKMIHIRIDFTFGSTSVASSNLTLGGHPAPNHPGVSGYPLNGIGWVYDVSATASTYYFVNVSATGSILLRSAAGSLVNNTTITWATGDKCTIVASYEAA